MSYSNVFVTVGTTKFDAVLKALNTAEVANILARELKCTKLNVQHGQGSDHGLGNSAHYQQKIAVDTFSFRNSIGADISAADLVISHAGAGSCIEVLSAGKPMIVVVNEELMGNHQVELAEQLSADGYILHCSPAGLSDTLRKLGRDGADELFRPYEAGSVDNFVRKLDTFMGFVA